MIEKVFTVSMTLSDMSTLMAALAIYRATGKDHYPVLKANAEYRNLPPPHDLGNDVLMEDFVWRLADQVPELPQ